MLEINFGDAVQEGFTVLSSQITLQFRTNQNRFKIRLSPVTVDAAESMGLGFFINSATIAQGSRATAGIRNILLFKIISYTGQRLI